MGVVSSAHFVRPPAVIDDDRDIHPFAVHAGDEVFSGGNPDLVSRIYLGESGISFHIAVAVAFYLRRQRMRVEINYHYQTTCPWLKSTDKSYSFFSGFSVFSDLPVAASAVGFSAPAS